MSKTTVQVRVAFLIFRGLALVYAVVIGPWILITEGLVPAGAVLTLALFMEMAGQIYREHALNEAWNNSHE